MFYYIKAIDANPDNYTIKITYTDNVVVNADFKDLLNKGVMTVLKNPEVFKQASIDSKGRAIAWKAQDIDFCADALRLKYH
jgi:5-carboxymethyl-2-hydroxymuconate isomerase